MATVPDPPAAEPRSEDHQALRHSLIVVVGGQLERVLGTLTALALRWGLTPELLGVYTGLRLYLDNANRSSLGVSLAAGQEVPLHLAAGRIERAERIQNVAHTVNSISVWIYALGLLGLVCWNAAWRNPALPTDPLATEWTYGLIAVALIAPLKRYQDYLIVMQRARKGFQVTTEVQVLDSLVFALLAVIGLAVAGLWGLLGAVGALMVFNIGYLQWRRPLRLAFEWDRREAVRLMVVGFPIWLNTLLFMLVTSTDRLVILWLADQPERSVGLYTVALMGTGWALDLAGRIVLVMGTYFQSTLGRTNDPAAVARQAIRATEAQATPLFAGSAIAYVAGPTFLSWLMPGYEAGVEAIHPLLPGMILLGLALGARQLLISLERVWSLAGVTTLGWLTVTALSVAWVGESGIVGVAWGVSLGALVTFLLTTALAYRPILGASAWSLHLGRLIKRSLWWVVGGALAAHPPLPLPQTWATIGWQGLVEFVIRTGFLILWAMPALYLWGRDHDWGGLSPRPRRRAKR
ncbi:hypothetical protein Isop_0174 [Isosphaera pallida ATCC 43644]|uniref:Polysaccharide biosynthesis protein n=1 Tax=Isosphaera pallida (strain ATCC 43644 / DSM 9630 / IS1B) TaxID=575540 RepID=E8R676_ISOPI|nr:oligosaccharide flippase family protein [Isosphaera pallida]ADV60771.1 hypothetical protein Isop_0174 [Isosphaera pallida ATCC 43644]